MDMLNITHYGKKRSAEAAKIEAEILAYKLVLAQTLQDYKTWHSEVPGGRARKRRRTVIKITRRKKGMKGAVEELKEDLKTLRKQHADAIVFRKSITQDITRIRRHLKRSRSQQAAPELKINSQKLIDAHIKLRNEVSHRIRGLGLSIKHAEELIKAKEPKKVEQELVPLRRKLKEEEETFKEEVKTTNQKFLKKIEEIMRKLDQLRKSLEDQIEKDYSVHSAK